MRVYRIAATLVGLTLAGHLCADIVIRSLPGAALQPPVVRPTEAPSKHLSESEYVRGTRSLLAPVGTPRPASEVTSTSTSPWDQWLEDPQRSLTLLGTMISNDSAFAVIKAQGKQYTLELGQSVGRWHVSGVSDSDVTFRRRDVVRKLSLPSLAEDMPEPQAPAPLKAHPLVTPDGPGRVIVDQNLVKNNMENPGRELRLEPLQRDGKTRFQFTYVDPTGLVGQIGFREGDILVAVNGNEITSIGDAAGLISQLEAGTDMRFTIIRGTRSMDLIVEYR